MAKIQEKDEDELDPAQAAIVSKVRRMALVSGLTTVIGIGAIVTVIGYRVFRSEGSIPPAATEAELALPAGSKVIGTALGEGRLAVTIETGGQTEIRLIDLKTMKPAGRVRLSAPGG
jgi:hypothetical protein